MIFLDIIEVDYRIVVLVIIIIIGICGYFIGSVNSLKQQINKNNLSLVQKDGFLREKDLVIQSMQIETKGQAQDMAIIQFDVWKKEELIKYQKIIEESGVETATALLQRWKFDNEEGIRKDAANRSVRVVLGKVSEHLIPFSEYFEKFNPKDARFIGSPIDLIVFDGAEEKRDKITIYFVEVKTGNSALSPRQKKVMEAVKERRVEWVRCNIKDFGEDVNAHL